MDGSFVAAAPARVCATVEASIGAKLGHSMRAARRTPTIAKTIEAACRNWLLQHDKRLIAWGGAVFLRVWMPWIMVQAEARSATEFRGPKPPYMLSPPTLSDWFVLRLNVAKGRFNRGALCATLRSRIPIQPAGVEREPIPLPRSSA